jgi:hypothetical protein
MGDEPHCAVSCVESNTEELYDDGKNGNAGAFSEEPGDADNMHHLYDERSVEEDELEGLSEDEDYGTSPYISFDPQQTRGFAPQHFLAVPPPLIYGGFNQMSYFREGRTVPAPLIYFPSGPLYAPPVLVGNPPVWTIPQCLPPPPPPSFPPPNPPPPPPPPRQCNSDEEAVADQIKAIEQRIGDGDDGHHKMDRHGNILFDPGPPIQTSPDGHGPGDSNLFVFHIPNGVSNLDLFNQFSPFGTVISARIMVDTTSGRSRGFGFVSYDNPLSAAQAIENMNGFEIGDKRLKVQIKKDKAPGPSLPLGYGPEHYKNKGRGRGRRRDEFSRRAAAAENMGFPVEEAADFDT